MAETEIERGESAAGWSAIWGMAVGVFALVMAETLPASLLTPMARGLSITEGMAGQAVTATAIIGFLTSLLITALTRRVDRRHMLLSFSILLIVANLTTALAGGLQMLLTGRLLLGFALGGFWTMAAATAMRLVPPDAVPRALSVVFGGVSMATVVTGPLGSLLGDYIGWRGVYLVGAAVGVVGFLWQIMTLPNLPSSSNATLATLLHVLKRRQIVPGMAAVLLVFTGHFAFFTYLRPFLETVTRVQGSLLSAILLVFGLANVVGTAASGWLLGRGLRFTLAVVPAGFTLIAVVLASLGGATPIDTLLVALWGFGFGAVPVAWTTWVTRAVPDEAESGSGLLVAAIQLAMAIGAGAGGMLFDRAGISGVFLASAAATASAVVIILIALRQSRATPE